MYSLLFFFLESPKQKATKEALQAVKENNCALQSNVEELKKFNEREDKKLSGEKQND